MIAAQASVLQHLQDADTLLAHEAAEGRAFSTTLKKSGCGVASAHRLGPRDKRAWYMRH